MSQVVIGDILPYTQATAILNQTVFGTNWTANVESDVVVYVTPPGDEPNDVTQKVAYPAGYSVAFIGSQQDVQVTLVTPSVAGAIVTITRDTPADRLNLYSNTNFVPSMLNNDFGILTLVDQQAQLVDQKIGPRYNYSAIIVDVVDTILPILGANETWVKNPSNTAIIPYTLPAGGIAPADATYVTITDETSVLPNSVNFAGLSAGIVAFTGSGFVSNPILGTTHQIDVANATGVAGSVTLSFPDNMIFPGTGSVGLPGGTTAQRVVTASGTPLRYNSTFDSLEFFSSGTWSLINDDTDGNILPGTAGQLSYYAANGTTLSGFPSTINQILYSSATDVVSGIATAIDGVLVTSHTGVPSILVGPGATGRMLQSNSILPPSWSTFNWPTSAGAAGSIVISDGTNKINSTSLWPNTVGAAGKIIRSDGTINAYSTATFADTYALNSILYANVANQVVGLATAVNGVLITDGTTGIPSISSTLPQAVQDNITRLGAQAIALNMNSHLINNVTDPVSPQDAATKFYVDQNSLNGTSVYAASAASLGTVTQSGSGSGATLTNAGAQATFALDGVNPPAGSNVLIKNTATGMTAANEGIYTVTSVGSGATNWILTRAIGYDTATEINNTGLIIVQNGSTLAGTAWYNTATIVTVDTTNFNFALFGTAGTISSISAANATITLTPDPITTTGTIAVNTATFVRTVKTQLFTSTGTYTPSAGMIFCTSEICGAGGGSGGVTGAAGQGAASGGGGGGGYCRRTYTAALIGANAAVVIGAGGTAGASGNNAGATGGASTFTPAGAGLVLTANGGTGGGGMTAVATFGNSSGNAGIGGTAGNGDINVPGGHGSLGMVVNGPAPVQTTGDGGGSYFGPANLNAINTSGYDGINYGTGATGYGNFTSSNQPGFTGAPGVCIVTEYCNQ